MSDGRPSESRLGKGNNSADVEAGCIEADGNKVSEAAGMFRRPALLARILPPCDNPTVRSLQQV
jgi:hypothetical protein